MTKLDSELFRNFEMNGSLFLILKTYFLNKQEMMNEEFDFNDKQKVLELWKKIKEELKKNKKENEKIFNFSTNLSTEEIEKYKNIIKKFGGKKKRKRKKNFFIFFLIFVL